MASYLLHENATVDCMHKGQSKPTTTDQHVKVDGKKIVTQTAPYTISSCSLPPPPNGNGPCATAMWSTAATRVKASGAPVLLSDSQATCVPTGTGLTISSTQTRVKGT